MFKLTNPQTGQNHTAKWSTIVGGAIAVACIIGVSFGELPIETLITIVAPVLGLGAMARRA